MTQESESLKSVDKRRTRDSPPTKVSHVVLVLVSVNNIAVVCFRRTLNIHWLHTSPGAWNSWNVHWNRQSFDWFVLCCIICSHIKRLGIWLPNILSRAAVRRVFPQRTTATATLGLGITQMSGQFSWSRSWADCPLNATTVSGYPR